MCGGRGEDDICSKALTSTQTEERASSKFGSGLALGTQPASQKAKRNTQRDAEELTGDVAGEEEEQSIGVPEPPLPAASAARGEGVGTIPQFSVGTITETAAAEFWPARNQK